MNAVTTLSAVETSVAVELGVTGNWVNGAPSYEVFMQRSNTYENTVSSVVRALNLDDAQRKEFWSIVEEVACGIRNRDGEVIYAAPTCACGNTTFWWMPAVQGLQRVKTSKKLAAQILCFADCKECNRLTPVFVKAL